VYEVTGRKVVAKTIGTSNETITISKTGIFIVRISDAINQPVLVRKIVIQ
jgi:hypothetical protein